MEAADIIFFEVESPDGFLARLEREQVFDAEHWQRLWEAVARLVTYNNGVLDVWSSYDLARVIETVQALGQTLVGRSYSSLSAFEVQILEANMFIAEMLAPS